MKKIFTITLLSWFLIVANYIAYLDPCAAVKAGIVKFEKSDSCVAECAVDGLNCPYGMTPSLPQMPNDEITLDSNQSQKLEMPAPSIIENIQE